MKRLLKKHPADLRFAVSIGLAIAFSRTAFEIAADRFGISGGLVAAAASGALIALAVGLIWPQPKKVSTEALAMGK